MTKHQTRVLQHAINLRCAARHLPGIAVDGALGPQTIHAGRRVAYLMGVKLGTGRNRLSQRARDVIRGTVKRSPAELARVAHRKRVRPLRLRAWDQMEYLIGLKV